MIKKFLVSSFIVLTFVFVTYRSYGQPKQRSGGDGVNVMGTPPPPADPNPVPISGIEWLALGGAVVGVKKLFGRKKNL